ncbi:MAG: dTMP kinase [Candidatus Nanohaloarchaea archaeon]
MINIYSMIINVGETMTSTFVTLEGMDATGKSTLIEEVSEKLDDDADVEVIPEFSDSEMGDIIRRTLTEDKFLEFDQNQSLTITSMLFADHFYQVENEIAPALRTNDYVLKERYVDSLKACQIPQLEGEYGSELGYGAWVDSMIESTPIMPDQTIYLELPRDLQFERIEGRGEEVTERDLEVFQNREEIYHQQIRDNPDRIEVYENTEPLDVAAEDLYEMIKSG